MVSLFLYIYKITFNMKYKRLEITENAIEILNQIKEKHGELIFHQSGGCCDGTAPMVFEKEDMYLDDSDIYKASIETYAENLSDGVIAPIFYLLLFGLPGAVCYKAINTLDSMIGYRNSRYERYGKLSAKLDDIANYIPARVTMLMIWLCSKPRVSLKEIIKDAKGHSSPNAGYPISAMAYRVGVSLGGDTSYFGKIVYKPYFGSGRKSIEQKDVYKALGVRGCIEIVVIVIIGII